MRSFLHFLLIISGLALSGCMADRLKFWPGGEDQKDYIITGIEHDYNANKYITSLVYTRHAPPLESINKNDMAISLSYRQEDVRRAVLKSMRSFGYYDARVTYSDGDIGKYVIDAGDISRIDRIVIRPKSYMIHMDILNIAVGDPLNAAKVIKSQTNLYDLLQRDNCAFALDVGHRVLLNPKTKGATIFFDIEQGQNSTFGAVKFSGHENIKESYLRRFIPWQKGECFRHDRITALRKKILATGLFSGVEAVLPDELDESGIVPVQIVVRQREQRSLRAGLSYYTDEGVGAVFGWEHRNFLGAGEKFNADLTLSVLEQSLKASLTKPYFLQKGQSIFVNTSIDRQDNDAYEQLAIGAGIGVKRSLNKYLSARLGTDFEITNIEEVGARDADVFGLFSPYFSLSYDSRDSVLDPNKGWLLRGLVEPHIDIMGQITPFIKSKLTAQTYYQAHDKIVLAGRVNLGTIAGTSLDDLPASERFFAGGGGSVRGFGYQEVGKFKNGSPTGGRSLLESSVELRYKFSDTIGAVAFIDAGQVGDNISPSFDDIALGAGLGIRYYTDFGPLRLDFGVPLSGKDNSDQNFQIYISIGQAF